MEFFIEINEETPMKVFTRTTLLNMLDVAEKEGAKNFYACFRKDTEENLDAFVKTFLFVGFEKLNTEEMESISMT